MNFRGISTSIMQMHLFPTAPWYISISLCVKYFIFLKGLTDIRTGPMQVNIQSSMNRFFKFSTISASCIFDISVMSSIPDLLWSADSLVYAAYENSLSLQYYIFHKTQELIICIHKSQKFIDSHTWKSRLPLSSSLFGFLGYEKILYAKLILKGLSFSKQLDMFAGL